MRVIGDLRILPHDDLDWPSLRNTNQERGLQREEADLTLDSFSTYHSLMRKYCVVVVVVFYFKISHQMRKKSPKSFENTINIFGEISKNISWLSSPLLSSRPQVKNQVSTLTPSSSSFAIQIKFYFNSSMSHDCMTAVEISCLSTSTLAIYTPCHPQQSELSDHTLDPGQGSALQLFSQVVQLRSLRTALWIAPSCINFLWSSQQSIVNWVA